MHKNLSETFDSADVVVKFLDNYECRAFSAFGVPGFPESLVITTDG